MATIFTQIIKREIPACIVAEDHHHIAFLDIAPIRQGHTLVVCKEEVDYFFTMSEERIARFMAFTKQVALAIEKTIPCKRVGMGILGFDVPHAHIHLVPLQQADDLDFLGPKLDLGQEKMKQIAQDIANTFAESQE